MPAPASLLPAPRQNTYGQTNVPSGLTGVTVAVGGFHNCLLHLNGSLSCFGRNSDNQLDVPAAAATGASQVSAGYLHNCAVVSGKAVCWGETDNGECPRQAGRLAGTLRVQGLISAVQGGLPAQPVRPACNSGCGTTAAAPPPTVALQAAPPCRPPRSRGSPRSPRGAPTPAL